MSQKSTKDLFASAKASEKSLRWIAAQIPDDVTNDDDSESKMLKVIKLYTNNAADCIAELTRTDHGTAKERVENELYSLETKWTALREFTLSDKFCNLKKHARELLLEQFDVMTSYKSILEKRLSIWED